MAVRHRICEHPVLDDSEQDDCSQSELTSDHDGAGIGYPPVHPVPTMQEAFEESIQDAANGDLQPSNDHAISAVERRRDLLDRECYDVSWSTRWKQRATARCHPVLKIMSQIIFGLHLLQQNQAKSEVEVVKILQVHVDEIDEFLEKTTEDFELAIKDTEERITFLKLPMQHAEVFDTMLKDKEFRTQLINGNVKIDRIIERTAKAMNANLHDVQCAVNSSQQLTAYLDRVRDEWPKSPPDQVEVYSAMKGNSEGWRVCLRELQDQGHKLHVLLAQLGTVVNETSNLAVAASRRNRPDEMPFPLPPNIPLHLPRSTDHSRKNLSLESMNKPLPKVPDFPSAEMQDRSAEVRSKIPMQHDIIPNALPALATESSFASRIRRMDAEFREAGAQKSQSVVSECAIPGGRPKDWHSPRLSRSKSLSQGLRSTPSQSTKNASRRQKSPENHVRELPFPLDAQKRRRRLQRETSLARPDSSYSEPPAKNRLASPAGTLKKAPAKSQVIPTHPRTNRGNMSKTSEQEEQQRAQLITHAIRLASPVCGESANSKSEVNSSVEYIATEGRPNSSRPGQIDTSDKSETASLIKHDTVAITALGAAVKIEVPEWSHSPSAGISDRVPEAPVRAQSEKVAKPTYRTHATQPPRGDAPTLPENFKTDSTYAVHDHQDHDFMTKAHAEINLAVLEPRASHGDSASAPSASETGIVAFIPPLSFEHDGAHALSDSFQFESLSEQTSDSMHYTVLAGQGGIIGASQELEEEIQHHRLEVPASSDVPKAEAEPLEETIAEQKARNLSSEELPRTTFPSADSVARPDSAYAPEIISVNQDSPMSEKRHIPFNPNVVIIGHNALTAVAHRPDRESAWIRHDVRDTPVLTPDIKPEPSALTAASHKESADNDHLLHDSSSIAPPIQGSEVSKADSACASPSSVVMGKEPLVDFQCSPRAHARLGLFPPFKVQSLRDGPRDEARDAPVNDLQPLPRPTSPSSKPVNSGRGRKIVRLFSRKSKNPGARTGVSSQNT